MSSGVGPSQNGAMDSKPGTSADLEVGGVGAGEGKHVLEPVPGLRLTTQHHYRPATPGPPTPA